MNFTNVLYVPNYQMSLKWRDQAEETLRAQGEGMTPDQIREFVYYFWRSVHPAIQIKNLAQDPKTNQVVIINDDHSIKEVLKPEEVKARYS
jgi:D-glycerate 3-kinase